MIISSVARRHRRPAEALTQGDYILHEDGTLRGEVAATPTPVAGDRLHVPLTDCPEGVEYDPTDTVTVLDASRYTVAEATVPGTQVRISISVLPADPFARRYAPNRVRDQWTVTRHTPETDTHSAPALAEEDARQVARALWEMSVRLRDRPPF